MHKINDNTMKNKGILSCLILGVTVGVGLLLLGMQIKMGFQDVSQNRRTVAVRGLSEREVTANLVTWPIVSKEVGNDLPSLYASIEKTNRIIVEFLVANGVAESEISINAPDVLDLQADRYSSGNIPFRYNVTNVVVVTSSQVTKINSLVKRQVELLKQGVAIVAGDYQYRIQYDYTDLNVIKPEMIADATKNAREAAEKFAEDSHSTLGKIKNASQGQFSIDDRDQYTPYIKRIRVVSSVEYFLKD